jgi:hypothetical protein
MRKMLLLLFILGISGASLAQNRQASWTNLRGLQVGDKIQVVEMNSKKHSGTFLAVSDSAVSFKESAGEMSVQRADVRSVKLRTRRRLRNTLIGAAAGGGSLAALCAATSGDGTGFLSRGFAAAAGAAVGIVIGAPIGFVLPTQNTIYRANSR